MLTNNKLLIDQNCPMCNIYGKCFTQIGLIDKATVSPYQTISNEHTQHIDMERARNEIALFNANNKESIYGIDAMIHIVSHNRTCFNRLLNTPPIYALLSALYNFISYNRKVIYPSANGKGERNCTPDVNLKYRWFFILFVALFTGCILNLFVYYINIGIGQPHNWFREFIVCFGQIAWQGAIIYKLNKEKAVDYLGNMSTVSLIGGILLIPILVFHFFVPISPFILLAGFMGIVGLMLLEHIRRCKLLGISLGMTASWVLYRMVVLAIILGLFFIQYTVN